LLPYYNLVALHLEHNSQNTLTKKIMQFLKPGLFLRLFMETNLELLIISYVQFKVFSELKSLVDWISFLLALISAGLCIVIPIFSFLKIKNLYSKQELYTD